jgi:hypothetical protein
MQFGNEPIGGMSHIHDFIASNERARDSSSL